jgi:multicomponent K+:H+ antiporter subunit E
MKNWLPYPLLSIILVVAWLMLAAQISVAHVLLALFLAWGIPLVCKPFLVRTQGVRNPMAAIRLIFLVMYDIVMANIAVARLILGRPDRLNPVFVQVPLKLTQSMSISLLAGIITMTPGTVSADLSEDNTLLLVHALSCDDPEALIVEIKERYEKPLIEIFGC